MAYTIQIGEMRKHDISELGLSDVVKEITCTMVCDHLEARRLTNFTVSLEAPTTAEGFTDFSALTEAQVVEWAEDALGEDAITEMHQNLIAECEACVTPSSEVVTAPPWVTLGEE